MVKHQKVCPSVQFLKIETEKYKKLLKIAQNGPKWLKMVKCQKVGPNVQFLNPLRTGGLHKIARFLSSLIGVPIRIL